MQATDASAPGAGAASALALGALAIVLWGVNPFAALLLVPAVHTWTLVGLSEVRPRPATALLLVLAGLGLPVAVGLYYMDRLSLNPLEGAWYAFLLVSGHEVGLASALMGCAFLGVLASVVAVALARSRADEPLGKEPAPRVRGPGGYAGPGSLGGTESALRR